MKVTYILFFVFPKSKTFHCNNIQTSTHLCFFPDAKQTSYKNNTTDSIRDWGLNPTIRPRSTALFFSPIWKVQLDDSERSSLLALSWPTEFFWQQFWERDWNEMLICIALYICILICFVCIYTHQSIWIQSCCSFPPWWRVCFCRGIHAVHVEIYISVFEGYRLHLQRSFNQSS